MQVNFKCEACNHCGIFCDSAQFKLLFIQLLKSFILLFKNIICPNRFLPCKKSISSYS